MVTREHVPPRQPAGGGGAESPWTATAPGLGIVAGAAVGMSIAIATGSPGELPAWVIGAGAGVGLVVGAAVRALRLRR